MDPAPTTDLDARHGEELAEITNGIVRLFSEYYGRGPTRAKSYLLDDIYVVTVLRNTMTTVERTLVDGGETDLVRELRLEFQEMVNHEFAEQVRTLTGRDVLACHSQIVFDPDILFEIFILDEPAGAGSSDADVTAAGS